MRRDTRTNLDALTPGEGEWRIDLTDFTARIGDGTTVGGIKRFPSYSGLGVRGDILAINSSSVWARVTVGNANTYLKSDGTDVAWSALPATLVTLGGLTVTRGGLILGNSTPAYANLVVGAANSVLTSNGTDASWSAIPTLTSLTINSSTLIGGASANSIEQYNSTSAQVNRLFNTRIDASNGEWFNLLWSSNILHIGTTKNGTGTARVLQIDYGGTTTAAISIPITSGSILFGGTISITQDGNALDILSTTSTSTVYNRILNGSGRIDFGVNGSAADSRGTGTLAYSAVVMSVADKALEFGTNFISRWRITNTGHLLGVTDNTYDIGATGATRPRTLYIGTSIISPSIELGSTSAALKVGTYSADVGVVLAGYITIKDSGGTDRKVAIVT